jgi:hypothetical protein
MFSAVFKCLSASGACACPTHAGTFNTILGLSAETFMRIVFTLGTIFFLLFTCLHSLYAKSFPKIEGWQVSSEILTFNDGNLWEHINGAADQFIDYDFIELQTCELIQGSMVISIEIYRMNTALHAFGIYTAERPSDATRLAIGGEAVILPPGQLLLLKDVYYIKIYAYEGEFTAQNGETLLTKIAAALPGYDGLPTQLSLLPEKFKIPGSESFIGKSFLGLKELRNCIFAEYSVSAKIPHRIFYILDEGPEIWMTLADMNWEKIELDHDQYLYRSIPYKGIIGLYLDQGYMTGIAFFEDIADINDIRARLNIK